MLPLVTITLIVLLIAGSIVVVTISQAREQAQLKAVRDARTLANRYRRLKRILNEVPDQYLAKEIRLLLLERSIDTLNEIKQIKGKEFQLQSQLDEDKQLVRQLKGTTKSEKAVPVVDEKKAEEIRKLLRVVINFIINQQKKGIITARSANLHINSSKYYIVKLKADLHENRANAAMKIGKLRTAIHHYNSAISALEVMKNVPAAQDAILALRKKINKIKKVVNKTSTTTASKTAKDKEWDNYMEDDGWKKKNTYDD
ncbi:MAG: hypothetical protein CSB48_05280 [Proteobacteria bacterium]|nr:MAG: hypothetical protein CSB48_05280 [Pseudomonadota bacterium]